jgi:hypothetical protein
MTTSAAAAGRVLFFGNRSDSLLLTYLVFFLSFFVAISFLSFDPIICFVSKFFFVSLRWTIMMVMKLSDNGSGD